MTILLLILIIPTLSTLLTYTIYCYEEANEQNAPVQSFLLPALRTALRSVVSETIILICHPLGFFPILRKECGKKEQPLVVLAHGLFHNPAAWIFFGLILRRQGFATICLQYPSFGQNLETTVENIRQSLEHIINAYPSRPIHLIGHSLGGLLLRAAVADMPPKTIRTLTTLGTPFGGSKLSVFTLSSLGQYLRWNGPDVTAIRKKNFPQHVKGLCLYSPVDNMVLPNRALHCELTNWTKKATQPISHVAMLFSRKVIQEVIDFIRQ